VSSEPEKALKPGQLDNIVPLAPATGVPRLAQRKRLRLPQLLLLIAGGCLVLGAVIYWQRQEDARVRPGFARSNGRIEVERIDLATKTAGRLAEVFVNEGDVVEEGAVIARIDASEVTAKRAALAAQLQRSSEAIDRAEAALVVQRAQKHLAEIQLGRAAALERGGTASHASADERRAQFAVANAMVQSAEAELADAKAAKTVAEANLAEVDATLADMTLMAPVKGRIEYRLAREGEVLAAGGKVVTLLDLADSYMTVFLPTSEQGRAMVGDEARILLDGAPHAVIPAAVSFVSSEAQFTPKAVETQNEREKLMYRVKLRFDPALLESHRDILKAGVTGLAYVRLEKAARWPATLAIRLPHEP